METSLEQIWKIETELLTHLLDVCQQHGLRCFMSGGSLLGVVRHKGFIPWDDDIDLWMPRPDYDRLLQVGPKEFQEPHFFQSAYTDTDYFHPHVQIRHSQTTAIRPSDVYQPFNQGIFIDVFPIDGVPDSDADLQKLLHYTRRGFRFLKAKNTHILMSGRLGLVVRKWQARRAVKKQWWTTLYKDTEDLFRQYPYETSQRVGTLASDGGRLLFTRDLFGMAYGEFQGMQVPIPSGWHDILSRQYGPNYMTPVRSASTHGEILFDVSRPYTEVLPEAQKQYRRSALQRLWRKIVRKI